MKDMSRFVGHSMSLQTKRRKKSSSGPICEKKGKNIMNNIRHSVRNKSNFTKNTTERPEVTAHLTDKKSDDKVTGLQDLDDIFGSMKAKPAAPPRNPAKSSQHSGGDSMPGARDESYGLVQSSGGRPLIISPNPAVHRFDKATGLPVYKYTALLVGDGGGTPLCPFDCACCF